MGNKNNPLSREASEGYCVNRAGGVYNPPSCRLKGVGFFAGVPVLAALPSRAFLLSCGRDARAPSTRNAGNAGVSPAMPTAREKTYPFKLPTSP